MDVYAHPNPNVREVAGLPARSPTTEGTVGQEFTHLLQRASRNRPREFMSASTPGQAAQYLLSITPEVYGTGVVVLDAIKDPETGRFGVLTATAGTNNTVGVNLHPLAANARQDLNKLSSGVLSRVFGWAANSTVLTIVPDMARWKEFMKASGREDGKLRGVIDAGALARRAVADGRIKLPPGTCLRGDEVIPLLCHAYLGRYDGPMTRADYESAFPGVSPPPYRRASTLYDWPASRPTSKGQISLHQVHHLQSVPRALLLATYDLVQANAYHEDHRRQSRELPRINKARVIDGLGLSKAYSREDELDAAYVQDEASMGNVSAPEKRLVNLRRKNALAFFGDLQKLLVRQSDIAPGAEFRKKLLKGRCMHCAHRHRNPDEWCDLARRAAVQAISEAEVNCDHCLVHDHYILACPTLHFRCQDCMFLGHITINCMFEAEEGHFELFMSSCRSGLFTRLERHGPLAGPFGFGVGVTARISDRTMRLTTEIRLLNEQRVRSASTEDRRDREEMVSYLIEALPPSHTHYLPIKSADESWTKYWQRLGLRLGTSAHQGPYRGPAAPLLEEFHHEPTITDTFVGQHYVASKITLDTDDVRCGVERVEGERAEEAARRRQLNRSLLPMREESERVFGSAVVRLSASAISSGSETDEASCDAPVIPSPGDCVMPAAAGDLTPVGVLPRIESTLSETSVLSSASKETVRLVDPVVRARSGIARTESAGPPSATCEPVPSTSTADLPPPAAPELASPEGPLFPVPLNRPKILSRERRLERLNRRMEHIQSCAVALERISDETIRQILGMPVRVPLRGARRRLPSTSSEDEDEEVARRVTRSEARRRQK